MALRPLTILRALIGAIIGAAGAAVLVFVIAGAISAAIGNDGGWALGFAMVMWLVPIGFVGGAILGGWAAASGRSSRVFRLALATGGVLTVLAIGLTVVLPDNRPKPMKDASGCAVVLRTLSLGQVKDDRSVAVYDRYCAGVDGHTVNVSVLPSPLANPSGPGNVLVLAGDRAPGATGLQVYADARDSLHLTVDYDHDAHVLHQSSHVMGYDVELRPSIGLPPQAENVSAVATTLPGDQELFSQDRQLRERQLRERQLQEMQNPQHPSPIVPPRARAAEYRPSPPGPSDHVDAEGCTVRQRAAIDEHDRHVRVYDRDCAATPHRTINVSLLPQDTTLEGPGNILVIGIDGAAARILRGDSIPVSVALSDSRGLEIVYDSTFRIVRSGFPPSNLRITFGPNRVFR